jgi:hypothetical protein
MSDTSTNTCHLTRYSSTTVTSIRHQSIHPAALRPPIYLDGIREKSVAECGCMSLAKSSRPSPRRGVRWGFPSWVFPNCSCPSTTVPRRFSGWLSIYPLRASWFLAVREKRYPVLTLDSFEDSVDGERSLRLLGRMIEYGGCHASRAMLTLYHGGVVPVAARKVDPRFSRPQTTTEIRQVGSKETKLRCCTIFFLKTIHDHPTAVGCPFARHVLGPIHKGTVVLTDSASSPDPQSLCSLPVTCESWRHTSSLSQLSSSHWN